MWIGVRKTAAVDHSLHRHEEILSPVHDGGHPASHHGPPIGEGHGRASPKPQGAIWGVLN